MDSIDANLKHPNEDIVEAAANALHSLTRSYFPVGDKGPSERLQKRVVDKYVGLVNKAGHPAETRGCTQALGALPKKLLAPSESVLSSVFACLIKAARVSATVAKENDAETRRNAVNALVSICKEVGLQTTFSDQPTVALSRDELNRVFQALLASLDDYNIDRRGDVGSWSRMAAMTGLKNLIILSINQGVSLDTSIVVSAFGGMLKQFAEKLDNVRAHAGNCMEELLQKEEDSSLPSGFQRQTIVDILKLEDNTTTNWAKAKITFPMVMQIAAAIPEYFYCAIEGMVISVGGLTESTTKEAEEALSEWLKDTQHNGNQATQREKDLGEGM